jgi:hypothetical protein
MVVEVIQARQAVFDPAALDAGSFPFRAGVTLIIEAPELMTDRNGDIVAQSPQVRFAVGRSMTGPESKKREESQRAFVISQGLAVGDTQDPAHFQANFGLLHEEF